MLHCITHRLCACGIDTHTAREKVRVARALTELPLLSEALAKGELGYSKVRALTRIATPENEDDLLNIGLHGTAEHVEKFVRLHRRAKRTVRRADALAWMAERLFEPGGAPVLAPDRHEIVVHVEADVLANGRVGRCEIKHGTAIAAETARRLGTSTRRQADVKLGSSHRLP